MGVMVQDGRELTAEEFAAFQAEQEEASRIAAIVAEWGPSFAEVAKDPRFAFEGGKVFMTLWKEIRVNAAMVPRLGFDEPTLFMMAELDRVPGEVGKVRRLLMQVCGMTEKEAGALGARDLAQAGKILDAFSGAVRAIGV